MYHSEGDEAGNVEVCECEKEYGYCENSKAVKQDASCEEED
jgi:hypothetical protein